MLSGINNQQPTCLVLVGDFNAKLLKWCPSDQDIKDGQDTFTTTSGYTEIIGQPRHIMNDKSSCIDLLFTTNSKLLCVVGVKQTMYDKCHRNIIYGSLNLNIRLPPPFDREVWDYKNTDAVRIKVEHLLIILLNIFKKLHS